MVLQCGSVVLQCGSVSVSVVLQCGSVSWQCGVSVSWQCGSGVAVWRVSGSVQCGSGVGWCCSVACEWQCAVWQCGVSVVLQVETEQIMQLEYSTLHPIAITAFVQLRCCESFTHTVHCPHSALPIQCMRQLCA